MGGEKKFKTHSNSNNELWLCCVLHQKYTDLFPLILMNKTCFSFLSLCSRIIWEFYSPSEILTEIWAVLHGSFPSKQKKVLAQRLPMFQTVCTSLCAQKNVGSAFWKWLLYWTKKCTFLQTSLQFFTFSCNSAGSDEWQIALGSRTVISKARTVGLCRTF